MKVGKQKWENINSVARVNTKADFRDKIDKRYGKIIVYGDLKDEIVMYIAANNIKILAALPMAIIGLFFWPAEAVGIGLAASSIKMMNYQGKEISGEFVFTHSRYLKNK